MRGRVQYGRTFLRKPPQRPIAYEVGAGVDPEFDELEKAELEAVEDFISRTDKPS